MKPKVGKNGNRWFVYWKKDVSAYATWADAIRAALACWDRPQRDLMDLSGEAFNRASLEFGHKMMNVAMVAGPLWKRLHSDS